MDLANYVLFSSLVLIAWGSFMMLAVQRAIEELREWLSFLDEESRENQEEIDNIYRVIAKKDKNAR